MPDLSRRSVLGSIAALAAGGLASGCGGSSEATDQAGSTGGPWSFTDDLGVTVELDATPMRIAGYGDQVAALWNFGVTPVAVYHYVPPADDPQFEGHDLSEVVDAGSTYGEINLETLAAATPDLIVTVAYSDDPDEVLYGFKDQAQQDKVAQIAPVMAIRQHGSALDVIKRNEELAASLGVNVDAGEVAQARTEFETAAADLAEAAESGLTVLPFYAETDGGLWCAKAPDDPALTYYQSLGVRFTKVGGKDYYWHQISWENADTYVSDVMLYSLRGGLLPDQLMKQPTFARLPAARAGQLHEWKFMSMDYVAQASYMRDLTGWLESSRDVT